MSEHRDLLYLLVWRDVKVRYKQTVLGAAWAILQPFLLMVVFSLVLGHLAHLGSQGLPYPIFTYSALVPWALFASSLTASSDSLAASGYLISKVYFPRLILPVAAAGGFVIDFLIAFGLLLVMMVFYGVAPTWRVVFVPLFTLLAIAAALSAGIFLAALNAKYRDVHYAVAFLVQLWLFASSVAYEPGLVPKAWRTIYVLNPMAAVAEGFRWALLGTPAPSIGTVLASVLVTAIGLFLALTYFSRAERGFADVI